MSLSELATETLQHIAEYLESARDINAFVQTCRHVYRALSPRLYRHKEYCQTPLHLAAANGHEAVVKLLLETCEPGSSSEVIFAESNAKLVQYFLSVERGSYGQLL